jgi:formylglycine-generating enzyme required for sulfatase activity
MHIHAVMCPEAVPPSRRPVTALLALLATLSCGSPGRPAAPSSGASSQCNSRAARSPGELSLLAWEATGRAEVRRLLGLGVVAVRYERAGCRTSLEPLADCVGGVKYRYTPYYAEDVAIVASPEQALAQLPLGAESLRKELGQRGAVRIDTVLAGQYALAPGQRVDGWDRPECERATHYVRSVYVGGLARTSGARQLLESAPSPFGMGGKGGSADDKLRWRSDGSPKACGEAEEQGGENAGCDAPLRLELVEIPPQAKVALQRAPAPTAALPQPPPPTCPSGMALIPGGAFMMGGESGLADEKPVHSVQVDPFCMDVTEVTVDAYTQCVAGGQCSVPGRDEHCNYGKADKGRHPINCVTWREASDYCTWQNKRLPTEEQWEYAARGGPEGRLYPWGSAAPGATELCWSGFERLEGTCEVGSLSAGPFGLRDMAGNVWEWTDTSYCDSYAESRKCIEARVVRGGCWSNDNAALVRASIRYWKAPSSWYDILGFRCVE